MGEKVVRNPSVDQAKERSAERPAFSIRDLPASALWLLPLVFLWFTLINHLRIEWSVNPQYGYGWTVPFLCAYLIWNGFRKPDWKHQEAGIRGQGAGAGSPSSPREERAGERRPFNIFVHPGSQRGKGLVHAAPSPNSLGYVILGGCALVYALTRLVQEANPEWRLISWALALEVISITLIVTRFALGTRRFAQVAFAICF